MAVKYTLSFDTNTGGNTEYELDILDDSFSGTPTKLKGQASPIEIKWKKDRDVYNPLMGSKASINLLLEDGDTIDDFNSAAEFTYEVRLRYKTPQETQPLEFEDNQLMVGDVLRVVSSGTYQGEVEMTVMDTNSTDPADRISQTNLESVLEVGDFIVIDGERYEVLFIGAFSDGVDARLVIDKESISGITKGEDILLETQAASTNDVWKGWMDPNDGEEHFGSYPLAVSYVATDGLGKLNYRVRRPEARGNVLLLHYIIDALEKTGLGLDIYIDSSIKYDDGNDALTTAQVDELAFVDADPRKTYGTEGFNADETKDVLEGILLAFNCSVRQSNGRWYIINNSLHGTETTSKTYKVYNYNTASSNKIDDTNYEEGTDVTETIASITYNLGGTNDDLYLKDESLYFLPRYPQGSIECKPTSLKKIKPLHNPNFDFGTSGEAKSLEGWIKGDSTDDLTLTLFNVDDYENRNVIYTTRNTRKLDNVADTWFQVDPTYAGTVSRSHPIKISFDHRCFFHGNVTRKAKLYYRVWLQWDTSVDISELSNNSSTNPADWQQNSALSTVTTSTTKFFWDFQDELWKPERTWKDFVKSVSVGSDQTWATESVEIPAIGDAVFTNAGGAAVPDGNPKFFIEFFDPKAYRENGNSRQGASSGKLTTYLDNINVESDYSADPEPVFERFQNDYVGTLRYEPNIIGSSDVDHQFYERLEDTDFLLKTDANSDTTRSLEDIVTLQKFKDNVDLFYAWEATLINKTDNGRPLQPIHLVNLDSTVLGGGLTSDFLALINGGTFKPKDNTFDVSMYSPNQDSTKTGMFENHDVQLIAAPPPLRSEEVTYVVSWTVTSVDDDDDEITDDDGNPVVKPERYWSIWKGLPETVYSSQIVFNPDSDYEIDGTVALDSSETDPEFVQQIQFDKIGRSVVMSFNIVMPDESEYEEAHFSVTADQLVGDNSSVVFDADGSGLTNANISEGGGDITEVGPVGQTERFIYHIRPSATYEITPSALTVTLDSVKDGDADDDNDVSGVIDSSEILKIQSGTGVDVIIPFKYVETTPVYAKISFSGAATLVSGEDTVDVEIRATEAGTETDDWSMDSNATVPAGASYDARWTATGVPGSPFSAIIEISPESGKYVDASSITLGSVEESWLGDYYVISSQQASSEALVFLTGTFPSEDADGDDSAEITVNCNVLDPASTSAVAHTYTWSTDTGYFFNNQANQYQASLEEGEVATFTISMEALTGRKLGTWSPGDAEDASPSVSYDIDIDTDNLPDGITLNSRTPYHTNGIVDHIDFEMKVTGQSSPPSGDNADIPFTGVIGDQPNLYTLKINVNSTDAYNAKVDSSGSEWVGNGFEIPFGDADLDTNISVARTFTIQSADDAMEYTASTKPTVSSSNTSIIADTNLSVSDPDDDGICTVTIDQFTHVDSIPPTGLTEMTLTVGGSASNSVDATSGSISGVTSDSIRANTGTTTFTVTANKAWKLESYSTSGLIPINVPTASFTPDHGLAGTFTVIARPNVTLGSNGKLVNSSGEDDNSGATSGTINLYLVANSQSSNFNTTNLDSDSFTWTAIGGAEDNIVSSLDVNEIRFVTTIPAAADQTTGVLYIK